MTIYDANGRPLTLDPTALLGEGGEAYVYAVQAGAAKIYRRPDDRYYAGPEETQREQRKGAKRRLEIIQKKLPAFPQGLPSSVVKPQGLLYADAHAQEVAGYTMASVKGAIRLRDLAKVQNRPAGMDNNGVLRIFANLRQSVAGIHNCGVVIGDFNPLNQLVVLVNGIVYLIDADSMQFGQWYSEAFTVDYVDPLVCDAKKAPLRQAKPHSRETDWYAFGTMLFESLCYLHPYLGAYEPADRAKRVPREERALRRITWFNPAYPGTKIPRFAVPFTRFGDDWAQYWDDLFHKDKRQPFPERMLIGTKWIKCGQCGIEHCRSRCPECQAAAPVPPAAIKEKIRGKVRETRVFTTAGRILHACVQNGKLRYLYAVNGQFFREGERVVSSGTPQAGLRFAISAGKEEAQSTLIGANNTMLVFAAGSNQPNRVMVDAFRGGNPIFVANGDNYFWANQGTLFRSDGAGSLPIGQVLEGQTRIWVGPHFGVGFYQAGDLQRTLVFDAQNRGINDLVALPMIRGQILEMHCSFSRSRAWLFVSAQEQGRTVNRCFVLNQRGEVLASAEAEDGDDSWLGSIHGKCAADLPTKADTVFALFAPTDKGLVRVQVQGTDIVENTTFPDTQGLVDSSHELLLGAQGIYVVSRESIRLLQINP